MSTQRVHLTDKGLLSVRLAEAMGAEPTDEPVTAAVLVALAYGREKAAAELRAAADFLSEQRVRTYAHTYLRDVAAGLEES